jgi:FixJ family two-component response regulator
MIGQPPPTPSAAPAQPPLVIIVDDEASVRDALDSLFRSTGMQTLRIASPLQLFAATIPDMPACIVLDVRMPGVNGLDFQEQLAARGIDLPIVFMTGHGDIPMTVRAMKAGAVDFLAKPFREQDMLDAVAAAVAKDAERRSKDGALSGLRARYQTLTPREREVFAHVVAGLMNKQIAGVLGLSEITVKIHRGNVTRKLGVRSVADLVRHAEALGITAP